MRRESGPQTKLRADRRSSDRPVFAEGWRKVVRSEPSRTHGQDTIGRIEIWVAHTAALLEARSCLQVLTEGDWNSLTRLQDPASRYSAIAARILVRLALSSTLDQRMARSHWRFTNTANGRPITTNAGAVKFSVSHVDELVAVAVSSDVDVGIDIESTDRSVSDAVIDAFCHADEHVSISDLQSLQRTREFIRLWTYKEAYSKLVGLGHALDFKTIAFLSEPVELRQTDDIRALVSSPRFESFWISVNKTLFHGALAFDQPIQPPTSTEIQFISLVDRQKSGQSAIATATC